MRPPEGRRAGRRASDADRDPARRPGGVRGPLRALLRIPLYHKLVGANVLLLATALAGGLWVGRGAPASGGGTLLLGTVVVAFGAAVNLALVRTALGPVEEIEETARRVARGEFGARASPSPVADRELCRLTGVFNRMLDALAAYRRRQRALTLRTFEREEREHAETARELRESTAQRVATLLVRLRAVGRDAEPDPVLEECRELARETLEDLRRTARGLRRPELDDLGLGRALRAHADELAGPEGPAVRLEGTELRRCLSRESRLRLYRILQEAVANAVQHAEAERVTVRLGVRRGVARAEVRDDGVGFRTRPGRTGVRGGRAAAAAAGAGAGSGGETGEGLDGGLGLVAMRERARGLGAELSVESEPGRGTRVRVRLPCDADGD